MKAFKLFVAVLILISSFASQAAMISHGKSVTFTHTDDQTKVVMNFQGKIFRFTYISEAQDIDDAGKAYHAGTYVLESDNSKSLIVKMYDDGSEVQYILFKGAEMVGVEDVTPAHIQFN